MQVVLILVIYELPCSSTLAIPVGYHLSCFQLVWCRETPGSDYKILVELILRFCTHAVRTRHSEHSPTHNKSPDNPCITIETASIATLLTLSNKRSWARVNANGGAKPGISLIRGQAFDRRESEE